MSASIYLEGGGDSKELRSRCREGFRKLLEHCGFAGARPHLVACGSRNATFDDFQIANSTKRDTGFVAMLIDSEEPLENIESTWRHLQGRDRWNPPAGASDEQVLFMTTCMETWIVADRESLAKHYGTKLQKSALPALANLEGRTRQEVQQKLAHATRKCPNSYRKGKRSFKILGKLTPAELKKRLPSFQRAWRILDAKLREA